MAEKRKLHLASRTILGLFIALGLGAPTVWAQVSDAVPVYSMNELKSMGKVVPSGRVIAVDTTIIYNGPECSVIGGGCGTVTYVSPETNAFGAFGHSIVNETKNAYIADGIVRDVDEVSVDMEYQCINPAKISENIVEVDTSIGSIQLDTAKGYLEFDTPVGAFGTKMDISSQSEQALEIGEPKPGPAKLLCSIDSAEPRYYDIELSNLEAIPEIFDIAYTITDPNFPSPTVLFGMSGSPIIQDGKLVAALSARDSSGYTLSGYAVSVAEMLEVEQHLREGTKIPTNLRKYLVRNMDAFAECFRFLTLAGVTIFGITAAIDAVCDKIKTKWSKKRGAKFGRAGEVSEPKSAQGPTL